MRFVFWIASMIAMLVTPSFAQQNHHRHHASYMSWKNSQPKPQGCCDGRDCGEIADEEERQDSKTLEVYVRGVGVAKGMASWCPVLPHHYLSQGNVADPAVSHICVSDHYGGTTPCAQFICYQPKPLI